MSASTPPARSPARSPASPTGLELAKVPDPAAVPRTGGAPAFDTVEDSPQFRDRVRHRQLHTTQEHCLRTDRIWVLLRTTAELRGC